MSARGAMLWIAVGLAACSVFPETIDPGRDAGAVEGAAAASAVGGSGGGAGAATGAVSGTAGTAGSATAGTGGTGSGGEAATATGGEGGADASAGASGEGGAPGGSAGAAAAGGSTAAGGAAGVSGGGAGTGGAGGALGGTGGIVAGGTGGSITGGTGGTGGITGGTGGTGGITGGTGGTGGITAGCGVRGNVVKPLLYTTLDDAASITSPAFGSGIGAGNATSPLNDFVASQCVSAIRLDGANEYARFKQAAGITAAANLSFPKGTIDFLYLPNAAVSDPSVRHFFSATGPGGARILIEKDGGPLGNAFHVNINSAGSPPVVHDLRVTSAHFTWTAGAWIRITVTWDTSLTGMAAHVYFDGVEPASYFQTINGPFVMPSGVDPGAFLYIGATSDIDAQPAGGLIDDFQIYGAVVWP